MANQWLRLWHDMPTDPKWRTIARLSGQPVALVQAAYLHLLVDASRNVTRGHVTVTAEDLASALDVTDEQITAVLGAMEGRVIDNLELTGWDKRQPKREDSGDEETGAKSAAERKREQRERDKAKSDINECHDASRNITLDKDKDTDKNNKTTDASASLRCPAQEIVDLYHACLPDNPKVRVLSEKRKGVIRSRWKEAAKLDILPFGYSTQADGLKAWEGFFKVCAESDFLTGRVPPTAGRNVFIADLDFLLSSEKFIKTLENKYHRESPQ